MYMILLLFLSLSLQADWQGVQHRISPFANEKNKILLKPALLCDNDMIDDIDADLVQQIRTAFKERQYGTLQSLLKDIDHPQALVALGLLNLNAPQGADYLKSAAEKYQSFEAVFNLGMCAYALKNVGQAIDYFEQATKYDTSGLSYCFLGILLQGECTTTQRSSQKAMEYLETAAHTYHVPEALGVLGYLRQPKDITQDSAEWRKLIDQEDLYKNYKGYGDILFNIGISHLNQKKKTLAYEYLHKSVDSYNHNSASYTLGLSYLDDKNYKQACIYLERFKADNDEQERKQKVALVFAYVGNKQYDEAYALNDEAVEHCMR